MLPITEQQSVASAHFGLHDAAQMTTLAITSKLTMIVASAAFSMMESRGSMRECSRNSTDGVDLGQEVSAACSAFPAQPSPTLGDTINAGFGYLEVKCLGCDTHQTVALDIVR
jgi:hypothetical protein